MVGWRTKCLAGVVVYPYPTRVKGENRTGAMEQCRVYQSDTLKSMFSSEDHEGESLMETALRAQLEDVGSPTRAPTHGRRRSRQNSARSVDSLRSTTGVPTPRSMQVRRLVA